MANKKRGFVEIELDKKRNLRYNFNAFCELEEALGRPLSELSDGKNIRMKDMRSMLWAGLIHEDPELSIEDVGSLIDEAESIQYVSERATEAIQLALGNDEKKKKAKKVMAK